MTWSEIKRHWNGACGTKALWRQVQWRKPAATETRVGSAQVPVHCVLRNLGRRGTGTCRGLGRSTSIARGAVKQADSIADRRFDKAQAAGELAVLAHNIAGHETRIGQLEADVAVLRAEGEQLEQDWQTLWADLPIEALAPDDMLAWLEDREDVVALVGRERDAGRQLVDSRKEEQEGIAQLRVALTKVGCDAEEIEGSELRVMVERAEAYRREQEVKAEKILKHAMRSGRPSPRWRGGKVSWNE